jgi:hypothetical protein
MKRNIYVLVAICSKEDLSIYDYKYYNYEEKD